ncbi:MAG: ATP-binding protein [Bacteroidota bacterium]|nr:ATP-binding protein [Bacteroidota bacterium]
MKKLKVLIVDNDFNVASNLNKQLHKMGYEVSGVAETYEDTIQKIDQCRPDLILMDLNLNGKQSKKSIESYLEIYIKDNIPVVFLSNSIDKTLVKKASIINNSIFLTKPVNSKELHSTIGLLLKSSGQESDGNLKNDEYKEIQRLSALQRYDIINSPADSCIDRITLIAAQFFNVPVAVIILVDKAKVYFISAQGIKTDVIEKKKLENFSILPSKVYSLNKDLDGKKIITDILFPNKKYCFYAAAPLTTSDGHILGTLSIMDKENRSINKSAEKILSDLAAIVMDEFELRLTSKKAVIFQNEFINIATTSENDTKTKEINLIDDINKEILNEQELSVKKIITSLIKDSSKQTEQIIDELFQSSVVFGGEINLKLELVNLADIALEVIEDNMLTATKKGQELKLIIESKPIVSGDRLRLKEVMENLINNAMKFSMSDTIIDVNVIAGEGKAYFEVKDQGQGLTDEDKEILFTKFAKLSSKPTAGESSTGIGLSIVKTIVEMHGGIVRAESEGKNMGSSFIIELPKIN